MGVISSVTKAATKAAKAKKAAAKIAEAKKKAKAAAAAKKAKIKKDYAAYIKQYKKDKKEFAKKANTDSAKEEAYESFRLESFTNPPDRSSGAKKVKAAIAMVGTKDRTSAAAKRAKAKAAKLRALKNEAKLIAKRPKPKKTFESELRALRGKAMTDANRQREASKLAVKYGRIIRMGGKTFGPKKGPPISRERIPGVKRNKKGEIIDRDGTQYRNIMTKSVGTWKLPQPTDLKEDNVWVPIPRVARTIPYGYKINPEDNGILLPIDYELDMLAQAQKYIKQYSYREVANWLTRNTGRSISHVGLKKRLDNERQRKNKAGSLRRWADYAKKAIAKAEEIEQTRIGAKEIQDNTTEERAAQSCSNTRTVY